MLAARLKLQASNDDNAFFLPLLVYPKTVLQGEQQHAGAGELIEKGTPRTATPAGNDSVKNRKGGKKMGLAA